MEWNAYQISLRLLSPMHIGWRKSGNLQQTRPYVTGRALWGALTARLTREQQHSNYLKVGKDVDDQLAFTYFYPSDCKDSVRLWPWGDDWDEFAWTYLSSYVSTSLADGHAAEEGSLHETEFISSHTRDGKLVYLVGYIFAQEACQLNWVNTLDKLQLGGERGYGWGRLSYKDKQEIDNDAQCFQQFRFKAEANRPVLKNASPDAKLLAHTIASDGADAGQIEPLIGRETEPSGKFGGSHSKPKICWKPGKTVTSEDKFTINAKGLWVKQ